MDFFSLFFVYVEHVIVSMWSVGIWAAWYGTRDRYIIKSDVICILEKNGEIIITVSSFRIVSPARHGDIVTIWKRKPRDRLSYPWQHVLENREHLGLPLHSQTVTISLIHLNDVVWLAAFFFFRLALLISVFAVNRGWKSVGCLCCGSCSADVPAY